MLHTKIVDTKKEKILSSNAEKFNKASPFLYVNFTSKNLFFFFNS